jgi:hypothetical protein
MKGYTYASSGWLKTLKQRRHWSRYGQECVLACIEECVPILSSQDLGTPPR